MPLLIAAISLAVDWSALDEVLLGCANQAGEDNRNVARMALLLAGLRGIDDEIWKAARIDGIPRWRVYVSIVIPMLGPSISTAFVLLFVMVVKLYDAVVAMTQGGPGTASEVPAKFIMDYLFGRANIGLASAASIVLLATVLAILAPFFYARSRAALRKEV